MTPYLQSLRDAMSDVVGAHRGIVLGQSVAAGGTALRRTTDHLPVNQLVELPVMEDAQLGMAIGMSLMGWLPICCYPRWNFLLLAASQLVNHLDKLPLYGNGFRPCVIVRVAVPSSVPLDPGSQHLGDYSDAFRQILRTVPVLDLRTPMQVRDAYRMAAEERRSAILVEYTELYDVP